MPCCMPPCIMGDPCGGVCEVQAEKRRVLAKRRKRRFIGKWRRKKKCVKKEKEQFRRQNWRPSWCRLLSTFRKDHTGIGGQRIVKRSRREFQHGVLQQRCL